MFLHLCVTMCLVHTSSYQCVPWFRVKSWHLDWGRLSRSKDSRGDRRDHTSEEDNKAQKKANIYQRGIKSSQFAKINRWVCSEKAGAYRETRKWQMTLWTDKYKSCGWVINHLLGAEKSFMTVWQGSRMEMQVSMSTIKITLSQRFPCKINRAQWTILKLENQTNKQTTKTSDKIILSISQCKTNLRTRNHKPYLPHSSFFIADEKVIFEVDDTLDALLSLLSLCL